MSNFNYTDRFLPNLNYPSYLGDIKNDSPYHKLLKSTLLPNSSSLLTFKNNTHINPPLDLRLIRSSKVEKIKNREISSHSDTSLEIEDISQDFYYHTITYNDSILSVAKNIDEQAIVYQIKLPEPEKLEEISHPEKFNEISHSNRLTCLYMVPSTDKLFSCDTKGAISIFNPKNNKFTSHSAYTFEDMIPEVINSHGPDKLYVGFKEGQVMHLDLRAKNQNISLFTDLETRICNIQPKGDKIAIGSNDDHVRIWDVRKSDTILAKIPFKAAVRGLDWFDRSTLLAGGGYDDPVIKVFDVNTQKVLDSFDTKSQITNIHSTQNGSNEFITSHGRDNSPLNVWKIKNMKIKKVGSTSPQEGRIFNSILTEPENGTLITASTVGPLRFWNKFVSPKQETLKTNRLNPDQYSI